LALFTSFTILAKHYLPVIAALCGKESLLSIIAKVTFSNIPRPPYPYRYFGKGNWVRMHSEDFTNVACVFGFLDDKEYFDGDTTEVVLGFYDDEPNLKHIEIGYKFSMFILDLEIATGEIVLKHEQ